MQTRSDDDIVAVFQQIDTIQQTLIASPSPAPTDSGTMALPSTFLLTRTTNSSPVSEKD
jgi:hypothetical protein